MNKDFLIKKFGEKISFLENNSIIVETDIWKEVSEFIKKNDFDYLMCVTSYDLEIDNKLGLAYNFYSTKLKKYH